MKIISEKQINMREVFMRYIWVLFVVLIIFSIVPVNAFTPEDSLNRSKVGSWVEMKTVTTCDGKTTSSSTKTTLKKRDSQFATLEEENFLNGQKVHMGEGRVPLNRIRRFKTGNRKKTSLKVLGEGNEEIIVNGKKFNCHWVKKRVVVKVKGKTIAITSTAWTSPDMPVCPLVKRIIERKGVVNSSSIEQVIKFGQED